MESFDKRKEGFEREFSRQEELRFKARARRNRKLGEWAGEKLGLTGPALEGYTAGFVERAVMIPTDDALVADLVAALAPADVSEHRIRRTIEEFGAEALADIQAGR